MDLAGINLADFEIVDLAVLILADFEIVDLAGINFS